MKIADAQEDITKIKMIINDVPYNITLEDNATAKDFIQRLPLEFELTDYARTEKVTPSLPQKLSASDDGFTPKIGDIAYYSPWGNIAIYYNDFRQSAGLYKIGKFDNFPRDVFASSPILQIKIEIAE